MKSNTSGKGINMNIIKITAILFLGLVIVVYSILLFTGGLGKEVVTIKKATDPKEIEAANKVIETLLLNNTTGVVTEYTEADNYLRIKVARDIWKKKKASEKKEFLTTLSHARSTLGLTPNLKIVDNKSTAEYASFENNRPTLSETDF
ncbi:MAG: hypothetical protein HQL05_07110 [Nitrospirae bacterium]|uniref:hypothetical protein n=1 Tax=Candidatus Magnetobacterium casense TaxID=1455061 RepID=UPI00058DD219|nr:hypothetical protein [Candidatus Magnetobacterium casensis]MBF0337589.1 hypothetical protein [Nitrospirota bacterium]